MFLTIVICGKLLPFSDKSSKMSQPKKIYKDPQLPDQPKLPAPVQDLSLAQVVNKLGMARVRLTHAKEVMVVDSSKATKIKVGLKQNISDS